MDLVLCNLLSTLIEKNERVALPLLGAFYHNKATGEVRFNKFDSWNDERFEYAYCSEYNVPFTTAKDEIGKFVHAIRIQLQTNSWVELPSVGKLVTNSTENSIDLIDITLSNIKHRAEQSSHQEPQSTKADFFALENEKPVENKQNLHEPIPPIDNNFQYPTMTPKKTQHIHRWIPFVLFLLIATFIFLIYQIQSKVPESASTISNISDTLSLKESFDNYPIDVPSIDSNDLKITSTGSEVETSSNQTQKPVKSKKAERKEKYFVIVGSRTSQELANEVQSTWTQKGYQCQILNANDKFRISVGSYTDKGEAEQQLKTIKTEVPDAWIFTAKD